MTLIVGTAGHIDHGKTTLVRALTGVDTDRLPEERQRGMSIELGYAYVPLDGAGNEPGDVPAAATLGFVDVPGHERFVHTMVAGASGIDFALLVVAANDGVMPQTREHLQILQLLGVRRGAVALAKCDRVGPARVDAVRAEITALLAGTPLAEAPVFPLDATDPANAGVEALRRHLHAAAREHGGRAASAATHGLPRLPIDRVFSLPGHGTVVTGTLHAGTVAAGDRLLVMPQGLPVRVRGLHAQNRPVQRAGAGERCAVNLAGVARDALARGDWLAAADVFVPDTRLDVRLRLLPGERPKLRDRTRLHVLWGTGHHLAHVVALEQSRWRSEASALVQLVFDDPVCAFPGQHCIVRDASAARTIGGAVVLDPNPPARRRRSPTRLAWLQAVERWQRRGDAAELLQHAPLGIPMAALARHQDRDVGSIRLPAQARIVPAGTSGHAFDERQWQRLRAQALAAVRDFHQRRPDEPGVEDARLRRSALPGLDEAVWRTLVAELLEDRELVRLGAWLHAPEHQQEPAGDELALLERLLPRLHAGGFDPPWVRSLAADTAVDEDRVRQVLRRAAVRGEVLQVVPDLFYHREAVEALAGIVADIARRDDGVSAARFRDAIGLGRKRAVQILECFDRVGYTRRIGDRHHLYDGRGWIGKRRMCDAAVEPLSGEASD